MWRMVTTGVLGFAIGAVAVWVVFDHGGSGVDPVPAPRQEFEPSIDPSTPAQTEIHPSLAEVAALDDDFERNAALYELLADAGVAEIEELLAEVEALDPAPHRPDLARVPYIRFAVLDPEAAVDHLIARTYKSTWVRAVFRAWAHADLDAAVARAATLDGDAKLLATQAILELEIPDWQREDVAARLGGGHILASIQADEDLRGRTDFAGAWQEALSVADPRQRLQRLGEVIDAWAQQDPGAAMAAAMEVARQSPNDPTSSAMMLQGRVLHRWVASNPAAAIAWLGEREPSTNLQTMTFILMGALARKGLAEAISTLETMPEHLVGHARQGLVAAMHVPGATIGDADFDTVLNWYSTLAPEDQEPLISLLSSAFVARSPEAALKWAISLDGEAREQAVRSVMVPLGMENLALAKRLVHEIEDEAIQVAAATSLIYLEARHDPRAALEWAESFNSESARLQLVRAVFGQWSNADPDEAVRELLRLRDADMRDEVTSWVAMSLPRNGRIDLAEQLFDALKSPDARRNLAGLLHHHYTRTDPDPSKAKYYEGILSDDG